MKRTGTQKAQYEYMGGFIGNGNAINITSCYWDVETSGQATSAGGAGAVGKTTAEMKRQASFAGWDFTNVWGIAEDLTYPYLQPGSPTLQLSVSVLGEGAVILDPPGGVYTPGTTVTLTAVPAPGWCFYKWVGAPADPATTTTTLLMDCPKGMTACFRLNHEIRTLAELQAMATGDLTGYYTLMNDIDASETATWNDEGTDTYTLEGFLPIGKNPSSSVTDTVSFRGVFNGNGKKITGLTIKREWNEENVGLFGRVNSGGEIRNLTLEGGTVAGYKYTGGVVGTVYDGLIRNCSVNMAVTGRNNNTGGLVGYNLSGLIEDCHATGDVTGKGSSSQTGVGGLVGYNSSGSIIRCSAGGTVIIVQDGSARAGGLVGGSDYGLVSNCFSNASVSVGQVIGGLIGFNGSSNIVENCRTAGVVTGRSWSGAEAGGLAAINYGAITRCFATGVVTGRDRVGGLVGYNSGQITDCFVNGPVKGNLSVGGLVGANSSNAITHCFASGSVQGTSNVGGLIGSSSVTSVTACYWDVQTTGQPTTTTITGAVGKTTPEMKRMATFAGWDFANVWGIAETQSYPYLRGFPEPFHLTVTLIQEGPGQVILDPPGGVYAPGTTVTLTAVPQAGARFAGWIGDVADPLAESISIVMDGPRSVIAYFGKVYEIRTLAELQAVATSGDMTGYYKLMNDLDASDTANWNDTGSSTSTLEGFLPIGKYSSYYPDITSFQGVFDGNGKKITGLTINRTEYIWSDREGVGLFGLVSPGATIKNLTLEGGRLSGYSNVGSLAGVNNGTLMNCSASGIVTGRGTKIGGLVGINKGTLTQCFAGGEVEAKYDTAGGLVGYNNKGSLSLCFSGGTVTGNSRVGGLVGSSSAGSISDCFATGPATASSLVGGLLGENASGSVTHSFACGRVNCTDMFPSEIGGLIGTNGGTVSGGYWDAISTACSVSAGSDAAFGKATAEMKHQATFSGWDFASTWGIVEGQSYPYLRAFQSTPPLFHLDATALNLGSVTLNPAGGVYAPGTVVTLTATPGAEHYFEEWSGMVADPTTLSTTIVMDADKSVRAHFALNQYALTIEAVNGYVEKTPYAETRYPYGTTVTLTALAAPGYHFAGWTGPVADPTASTTAIFMNGNKTVTAHFEPDNYPLTILAENGSVTKSPDRATYTYGATVTLTATPDTGYVFAGWTGDVPAERVWQNPLQLGIKGPATLTARFVPETHPAVWMVR
ncbi:MAG TPA: GLUG motif-containing protein [Candidatus Sumerlaeota bacterium]|nr:GLUG motif-containing protein [Candidatus Sumerlaeota bacterium]